MLDGPCFTQPLKRAPGGDYLAMGSVHEKLYLRSLPGMNNTVRHIRPYSALCWMAREIEKHARARNLTGSAAAAVFNAGLWKIDALMLWTSHGDGTGLPGYTKFDRPVANNDLAGITNRRTRLFSPANYQPSLVNGFGWLQLDATLGIYVCSEAGGKLADAFESHLRETLTSHQIRWLADPYQTVCGPTKLAALQPALTVATTVEETKAFTSSFVRVQYADDWAFGGPDRRATLLLALRAIDALNGTADDHAVTDLDHIREAMLCGVSRAGVQLDVSIGTARQQWHVMQLRALQRLAMECLLLAAEVYVMDASRARLARGVVDVANALGAYASAESSVAHRVEQLERQAKPHGSLFRAGLRQELENLRYPQRMSALHSQQRSLVSKRVIGDDMGKLVRTCIDTLVFCAVEAQLLAAADRPDAALTWDGNRLALAQLAESTYRLGALPLSSYTAHIMEAFVLVQHFQTAAHRSVIAKDGQQRFVLIEGPTGLLRTETSRQLASNYTGMAEGVKDGLFHALLLLASGGLLKRVSGNNGRTAIFRLKASGRTLLSRLNAETDAEPLQ